MSHAGASHNDALREWLARETYDLSIAGPYRDEAEGKNVEAALISALRPQFNIAPGDGCRFAPLGVPPELADRPIDHPLTVSDIGRRTRGALLVYLAAGDMLADGRRKFDAAQPRDEDVLSNIRGVWDIGRHLAAWRDAPSDGPQVLIGVHGRNTAHRFIVGAVHVDTERWGQPFLAHGSRWEIPLRQPIDLDACELRGRRVQGAAFSNFSWRLHIWVDAAGATRHP
jgi:hypothetical protein